VCVCVCLCLCICVRVCVCVCVKKCGKFVFFVLGFIFIFLVFVQSLDGELLIPEQKRVSFIFFGSFLLVFDLV